MTEINPPKTNSTLEVAEAPAPVPSRTILVATDFSDASGDAIKWVRGLD